MNKKTLLQTYHELPFTTKWIFQLLSLFGTNINKTNFLGIINASDIKEALGKQYTNQSITLILNTLLSQELLTQSKKGEYNCNPYILHDVLLDAVNTNYSKAKTNLITKIVDRNPHSVDKLKLGLYLNDIRMFKESIAEEDLQESLETILKLNYYFTNTSTFASTSTIIDKDWLNNLLPEIQHWVVAARLFLYMRIGAQTEGTQETLLLNEVISNRFSNWQIDSAFVTDIFLDFFVMNGDLDKISYFTNSGSLARTNPVKHQAIFGIFRFLHANNDEALIHFDLAIRMMKDRSKKRNVSLSGTYGIFHILSLLRADHVGNLSSIKSLLKHYEALRTIYYKEMERVRYYSSYYSDPPEVLNYFTFSHSISYDLFGALIGFLEHNSNKVDLKLSTAIDFMNQKHHSALDSFILLLILYWTKSKILDLEKFSSALYRKYNNILFGWASVLNNIMNHLPPQTHSSNDIPTSDNTSIPYTPYKVNFIEIIEVKPEWERAINALSSHFEKHSSGRNYDLRLIWRLSLRGGDEDMITPIEQKKISSSSWNKGRAVGLKRLLENQHNLPYVSVYDKSVISSIEQEYGYRGSRIYYINHDKALLALANHPLVFDADTGEHVELIKAYPELVIKEEKKNYHIKLSENVDYPTVKLRERGVNKYQVLEIDQSIIDIKNIIGTDGIVVPQLAKEKILSLIQNAASDINVRTEFDTEIADSKPGDSSIIIQLMLIDDVLKLKMFVRPFGDKGSYYKPAKGNINITAQIDNMYQVVTRNLVDEQNNVIKLLNHCNILYEQNDFDYEWKIDELETALEILYQLNDYKIHHQHDNPITLEWPHGQSLYIDKEVSFDSLKLNITTVNEWFTFDGSVEIQESQVMEMKDLLARSTQSKGRFIELSDRRFIALTESFAKRLAELNIAAKTIDNGEGQAIHKLAAPLLLEFAQKANNVHTDSQWRGHIDKITSAETYDPKVPNDLQAELRPYQIDGFKWLARLSNLGFGACLADDMGLGKTIQAIALLLTQSSMGPCLVLAPASVCYVWEEECKKFAPSLNCISLARVNNNNRETQINNLGKMDVLICSYGILYQIEELLLTKEFRTIVLDEAQAIKNFNTKRFKIITKLKTINKIALSGTPVENRCEELWNLFEFLNPGFLGSRSFFQTKYTKPIEVDKNINSRNTLKRLIQPFILRRIKSKVLDELPPKIEQTIFIEPTDQERSFYEALRRESIERINSLDSASSAKKRFSILAEITKLRRACCDSSLVDERVEIPNSKLEAFDEIISELKQNNHRALVFSQYVGYLGIVKKRLDNQKISYQYLDGSCSQKQRQNSVEAFQSGVGDLFLISLKAGGVGLNLTAADYVIHLDPWWNPAIEDQASDRAHRIGQTRPVTIYRLVMKDSIEEKILKMHSDKRDLAISLLSDSDKNASLNETDLLELINESIY